MYLARFSYDVRPVDRQRAMDSSAARLKRPAATASTPGWCRLTRGRGDGAGLQFEVELQQLDQLDHLRNHGIGSREETGNWMHAFSEVLTAPPCVEILHVDDKAG